MVSGVVVAVVPGTAPALTLIAQRRKERSKMVAQHRCQCGTFINRVGRCPSCGDMAYEVDPVAKVRRRIEDYLRKADQSTVMRVANSLNIKTT